MKIEPPPHPSKRHYQYVLTLVAAFTVALFAAIANNGTHNPSVQEYYTSLESRLGYWLLLGNTRHCGLYPKGQLWPFPVGKAQRAMEDYLFARLDLKPGSRVLDAGAGSGYVAMRMAEKGLTVEAVDITPLHVEDARRNVKARGLQDNISVRLGDYHNLTDFDDGSFDGIYTMETFVHADDPLKVLQNFYRLLRPGGVLVQNEADFNRNSELLQDVLRLSHCQNTLEEGVLIGMLEQVGFKDVQLDDLTDEVAPLWRLFGVIGYIPYRILRVFGLHTRFTNLMAGVESYLHWGEGRYISVRAIKP
ncbi:hypothetical protein G647_07870 [Cladophialophora carrionii CBS 160.54]|uniref:Methyltransferase type 11 domain-containing protein n=1 Tax=Cladophialophora carrionii CBS 160.54 TaxID=1279043 RepID=V9D5F4_9EURO|nr:uncharacterized protein G647_07870 [Cladophialophora carrionii CBS 160.54]ETI21523.1 hypothetical protein G647_07870 [Cladophialophora carrionii CBS 160.54]